MVQPISSQEILEDTQASKNNKTPGKVDYPFEFYIKKYLHILISPLMTVCNDIINHGVMPDTWEKSEIVVIHQKKIK